jgi:hypothetical protein
MGDGAELNKRGFAVAGDELGMSRVSPRNGAEELARDFSIIRVFKSCMWSFIACSFGIWVCASASRVRSRNLVNSSTPSNSSFLKSPTNSNISVLNLYTMKS